MKFSSRLGAALPCTFSYVEILRTVLLISFTETEDVGSDRRRDVPGLLVLQHPAATLEKTKTNSSHIRCLTGVFFESNKGLVLCSLKGSSDIRNGCRFLLVLCMCAPNPSRAWPVWTQRTPELSCSGKVSVNVLGEGFSHFNAAPPVPGTSQLERCHGSAVLW